MLDNYFLYGAVPGNIETGVYQPFLVFLSYVAASFGSYTGLILATYMAKAENPRTRGIIHLSGAFALGSGIWSMHFIGMLAYKMNMAVTYDPFLTVLSMVIAVGTAYCVLAITQSLHALRLKVIVGSLLLGISISTMHYTGMAAMKMDADLRYIPGLFALSVAVAIAASAAAMGIIFFLDRYKSRFYYAWQIGAALIMGAAICGMHYTGMEAAVFIPHANCRYNPSQNFSMLALSITAATAIIFAIALVLGVYARERNLEKKAYLFPYKILAFSLMLTLLATLWTGGNSLYADYVLRHGVLENLKIAELGNQIAYLDSVLSRLARERLVADDPEKEKAYNEDVQSIDETVNRLVTSLPEGRLRQQAVHIDKVRDVLESMDMQSLNLARQGKYEDARKILDGPNYMVRRHIYENEFHRLTDSINDMLHQTLAGFDSDISYTLYLEIIVIITLPVSWFFSFRSLRRWRLEMEATRSNLVERELELQRFIGEMEISRTEAIKAQTAAERANAAKSDFLANMSHEIRTPMNGLLGMARLLLGTEMDTEQRNWAEIIYNSGDSLMNIINDILDFSKIESGRLKLESLVFDVNAVLAEVTDMLILRAQEKNIELIVRIAPGTPCFLMGDAIRLKQVMLNLLANAIKFTSQGHVLLDVSGQPEGDYDVRLAFRIEDTGIGIPPEKLGYIFDKFSQAEESTTRRFGGTGLGLTISQRLITMMGGAIKVDSTVGKGSVFHFDISLPKAVYHPPTRIPDCGLENLRVLVLCDNELNQGIFGQYLDAWQMQKSFCPSAAEILQCLQDAEAESNPFHFVYIDYKASVQKILDLIEKVKIFPELQSTMFVIGAIFGSPLATRVLNNTQISALLTKPLFPDQLQDAFKILWDAQRNGKKPGLVTRGLIARLQSGSSDRPEQNISFHGTRVLVVEDMKVNQLLMTKILEKLGCSTDAAFSGVEAVEKLHQAPYDIVFMDCQMPIMDGFEATHQIRQAETANGAHAIIVALTADAMTGDREKCLESGMDDYLNKPVKPEQIAEMLKKWVIHS